MSDPGFSAQRTDVAGTPVLQLGGDLTGAAGGALAEAVVLAMEDGPTAVVLDFTEVGYINSTGIAAIIGLISLASDRKVRLRACGLTDHYVEIFEITQLSRHVDVLPTVQAAIDHTEGEEAS